MIQEDSKIQRKGTEQTRLDQQKLWDQSTGCIPQEELNGINIFLRILKLRGKHNKSYQVS